MFGDLVNVSRFDPRFRYERTQRKCIRLYLLPRLFSDDVKVCRHAFVRRVKQKMRELVKQYQEFFVTGKTTVNNDVMTAEDAIVKPIRLQRIFIDRDLELSADAVKIRFGERTLVPVDTEF